MLHCHSYWSDGNAFPEQVVDWYVSHGYDFLCVSDHNEFQDDPGRWHKVKPNGRLIADKYVTAYAGAEVRKTGNGDDEIRLKTFSELKRMFDDAGKITLIPGFEMTHKTVSSAGIELNVHMNVLNAPGVPSSYKSKDFVYRYSNESVADLIRKKGNEAKALMKTHRSRQLTVLNHPIWKWYDVSPEDLIANSQIRHFEVCDNGGVSWSAKELPGDGLDADRFWDVVNAFRARRGEPLLYGIGTDDAHNYFGEGGNMLMPGNAWTRVFAKSRSPDDLMDALEAGDSVACEGLEPQDVRFDAKTGTLSVSVAGKPGSVRRIVFIVSKADFPEVPVRTMEITPRGIENEPGSAKKHALTRQINVYSDLIGKTVKVVEGRPGEAMSAAYQMTSGDLYVRARIESSEKPVCTAPLHPRCFCCWTQPQLNPHLNTRKPERKSK